eukprot:TRINITY_DN2988_c1_g1_i3.p3 TRINITY_DN2988_c1_g1~~TRINITY_DN2988_c1_g1_i3.p3  ORF type:complete len:241 (+),score=19.73 TRINITY_DN2988_c1_g1_i3:77-799(+)
MHPLKQIASQTSLRSQDLIANQTLLRSQDLIATQMFLISKSPMSNQILKLVNQPDIVEECTTVADSANGNPELSILASALQATNLVDELNDTNLVATVLFPINKAFEELVNFFNSSTPQLLADSQTRNVLLYHIIPDVALFSQDLEDGATFTTLLSQNLTVDLNDGIEIQGGSSAVLGNSTAKVIAPDVEACNAVIHVIDKLLLPNFNLSDLQGASRTSPTNDLLDLEGANLTNLAPQAE